MSSKDEKYRWDPCSYSCFSSRWVGYYFPEDSVRISWLFMASIALLCDATAKQHAATASAVPHSKCKLGPLCCSADACFACCMRQQHTVPTSSSGDSWEC